MKSAIVYLPVTCPTCQRTTRVPFTRLEITDLLQANAPFQLHSLCHPVSWAATEEDRKALFALIKPDALWLPPSAPPASGRSAPG